MTIIEKDDLCYISEPIAFPKDTFKIVVNIIQYCIYSKSIGTSWLGYHIKKEMSQSLVASQLMVAATLVQIFVQRPNTDKYCQ